MRVKRNSWGSSPKPAARGGAAFGRGSALIRLLRVLILFLAAGVVISGILLLPLFGNSSYALLLFLGIALAAMLLLACIMVCLDMAANAKSTADNTAMMLELLQKKDRVE